MGIVLPPRIALDELLELEDRSRYELLNGELVERLVSEDSVWIGGEILYRLRSTIQNPALGWVFGEGASYRCFSDPERVRRADVSFILKERRPDGPANVGYTDIAPDLVVEVVSPWDLAWKVNAKVHEWLEAGVPVVWLVMPQDRTVTVYTHSSNPVVLAANDEITFAAIPGFRCQVDQFFPPRRAD